MGKCAIARLSIEGLGKVWVACTTRGIAGISLAGGRSALAKYLDLKTAETSPSSFDFLKRELTSYANGKRVEFVERTDLTGTPFQRRVWRTIASIPWGQTRSYKWLALKTGRPRAVRAAANACGANPLPVIIPCHRVIASDGSIGGFSSGLRLKRRLLMLEGVKINY